MVKWRARSPGYARAARVTAVMISSAPYTQTAKACKHCGATDLHWGFHYGYFWRCGECGGTANMPTVCSSCGTKGRHGKGVRIRKKGKHFFRECDTCETSEIVWIEE